MDALIIIGKNENLNFNIYLKSIMYDNHGIHYGCTYLENEAYKFKDAKFMLDLLSDIGSEIIKEWIVINNGLIKKGSN